MKNEKKRTTASPTTTSPSGEIATKAFAFLRSALLSIFCSKHVRQEKHCKWRDNALQAYACLLDFFGQEWAIDEDGDCWGSTTDALNQGFELGTDCDDTNTNLVSFSLDVDCDTYLSEEDCDDYDPIKPAEDAVIVDTSKMSFETAVGTILNVIKGTIT